MGIILKKKKNPTTGAEKQIDGRILRIQKTFLTF